MAPYDNTPTAALSRLEGVREEIANGRLPAWIFNNPGIYKLEIERLFGRTWVCLGHESELRKPGDYVTRYIGNDSVIVARDEHGNLQAHLNMCRHRGNPICKSDMGNASHFRCSYHGWTYKNSGELVGVPYLREAYDGKLDRSAWALARVPLESYRGLLFGTLNPDPEPFESFLSGFEFYLDFYLKCGPNGAEVYGPPDYWEVDTDWKICAENSAGDGYHTPVTHQFGFELGYFASSGASHFEGYAVHMPGKGHAIGLGQTPGMPPFFAFPDDVKKHMESQLSPAQLEVFSTVRTAVCNVFPNLALLVQPFSRVPGEPGVRFCMMRLWHPVGPGRMRSISWCLVPADASEEYKDESYKAYVLAFGQSGLFEQDDYVNWTGVTRQAGTVAAKRMSYSYEMGLDRPPEEDFPGPGHAVKPYVTEANFRNLWLTWLDYVTG